MLMLVCLCLLSFWYQGVTYCGESKASTLTMENVPWHEEVGINFKISILLSNSRIFVLR